MNTEETVALLNRTIDTIIKDIRNANADASCRVSGHISGLWVQYLGIQAEIACLENASRGGEPA